MKSVPTIHIGGEGWLCGLRGKCMGRRLRVPDNTSYTCKSGASLGPSMLEDDVVHYLELSTKSGNRR